MKEKMSWEERRKMHLDLWQKYFDESKVFLIKFAETRDFSYYKEHERLYRLSNKHWGIAQAMWTRRYGH